MYVADIKLRDDVAQLDDGTFPVVFADSPGELVVVHVGIAR